MTPRIWNTLENLAITIITLFVINFLIIRPLRTEMREQFKIVAEIAAQPKYSINNDFEKMRTKKGGSIILDLNNELNSNEVQSINNDSIYVNPNKKSFWQRLIKTKNKDPTD